MDPDLKKSIHRSRFLLFGLLVKCLFAKGAKQSCPLSQFRYHLSIEEKYDYVMGMSVEDVYETLEYHDRCYSRRIALSGLN